jgi:hypothetical protein
MKFAGQRMNRIGSGLRRVGWAISRVPGRPTGFSLAVKDLHLFAGTSGMNGGGVIRSFDDGNTWSLVNTGLKNTEVWSIAKLDTHLYAGTAEGVFRYSSGGPWTPAGLPGTEIAFVETSAGRIFAGTSGDGIWLRPLSEITTAIGRIKKAGMETGFERGTGFLIRPETKIGFTINRRANVNLSVYDTMGKKVATILDSELNQGAHQAEFNGTGLNNGFYFLRLRSQGLSHTHKFLFEK